MEAMDAPPSYAPPPPPKRPIRPKITLQIPDSAVPTTPRGPTTASVYWGSQKYRGRPPTTPMSHVSDPHGNPYFNPFIHNMYHNKASEFMFKQFEGFKDFTMNTAKSGLSAGEKSAFWFVNKLKILSKKWFTHFFLTLCLALYSLMGAAVFMALEEYKEHDICLGRRADKTFTCREVFLSIFAYTAFFISRLIPLCCYLFSGIAFVVVQTCVCFVFCS